MKVKVQKREESDGFLGFLLKKSEKGDQTAEKTELCDR